MDETHHARSSSGGKGGTLATTLMNPEIVRSGYRYVKDSNNHTTGCYESNTFEAVPSVYIYDSKVKDKTKLKLRPDWCDCLPIAKRQWGLGLGKASLMDLCMYVFGMAVTWKNISLSPLYYST